MIQRDVFSSNEYVEYFKPDEAFNPFRGIYGEKREAILAGMRGLPAESAILDLGGGMGRLSVPLARDHHVTLSDLSGEMLRRAEATAHESKIPPGNLQTVRLNAAEPLPFPNESFNRVLCIDLLVHLPDPIATLREVRRVLKPAGELVIDMSNSNPLWLLRYPRYVGRRPQRWIQTWRAGGVLPEWQGVVRHYTRDEFHYMLSSAGFRMLEECDFGPGWCPKWFLARCRPDLA